MIEFFAFGVLAAFCLYQILPLILAFRGLAAWWLAAQASIGVLMLALALIQNDGRGSWVILVATGVMLAMTTVISVLLALAGFHFRRRNAHQIQKGNAECPSS